MTEIDFFTSLSYIMCIEYRIFRILFCQQSVGKLVDVINIQFLFVK